MRTFGVADVLLRQAGTETFIPGNDRPLLLLTGPPSVTEQTTSDPSTCSTTNATLPSSTNSWSPGAASFRPWYVVPTPIVVADDVLDGDPHGLAGLPPGGSLGKPSQPDLGPLQIGQDADCPVVASEAARPCRRPLCGRCGHRGSCVEPGHIHARIDQCTHHLICADGGPRVQNDLSASSHDASA